MATTHAEVAARLLRDAATFFGTLGDQNPPLREQMHENASVFRQVADLVEADPAGALLTSALLNGTPLTGSRPGEEDRDPPREEGLELPSEVDAEDALPEGGAKDDASPGRGAEADTPLKVAFDVDGVITEAPRLFAALSTALRRAGHEVYVVSDHDELLREHRERELAGYGIAYDALIITRRKTEHFEDLAFDFAIDDEAEAYYPRHTVIPLGLVRASRP